MHYEAIRADTQGRVGILTLNRPEKLNAWNAAMTEETIACLDAWADDPGIGAIVLTGAGRAFCAGADFAELAQGDDDTVPLRWVEAVRRTKPIVVAFNGFAVGMGLSVTLPCAVRIASTSARMSMRFVRVGLVPEGASTTLLPAIVGLGWATNCASRRCSADEALAMGVNRLYPPDDPARRARRRDRRRPDARRHADRAGAPGPPPPALGHRARRPRSSKQTGPRP